MRTRIDRTGGPRFRAQRLLCLERRAKGLVSGREGHAEGVADRLKDVAAVRVHRPAHQVLVALERAGHLLGRGFPQMRRALDVSEEQCHGPTWN